MNLDSFQPMDHLERDSRVSYTDKGPVMHLTPYERFLHLTVYRTILSARVCFHVSRIDHSRSPLRWVHFCCKIFHGGWEVRLEPRSGAAE